MAAPGLGYNVLGAFRLNSRVAAANIWPVVTGDPGTAIAHGVKLGYYDQIPLLRESIGFNSEYDQNETLDGDAGYKRLDKISDMPGGNLELNGFFNGLDALIAAAMGFERWRNGTASITTDPQAELESPVFGISGLGGAALGLMTTAAGTTGSTLASAGTEFTGDGIIGDWVRIIDNTANAHTFDQVRKITARGSTSQCTVAPAWAVADGANPVASKKFEVAREFLHTFELSRNMHGELFSDILSGNWNPSTGKYINRAGILGFMKGVSYWELQYAMVNKLTFKLDSKGGLTVSVELLGLYLDIANAAAQNSTAWYWVNASTTVPTHPAALSGTQFGVIERAIFPKHTFRMDAFSTSSGALAAVDDLQITSAEITIDNKLKGDDQDTKNQYKRTEPVRGGKRNVSLSFEVPRYLANTRLNYYRNQTDLMGALLITGSTIAAGKTNELKFFFPRFRLKPVKAETPGASPLTEKVEAVCLQCTPELGYPNSAEFPQPTTGLEKGELIIQTRNQNPFNAFMDQNQEY